MTVLGTDVEIEVPPGTTLSGAREAFEEVTGPWPGDWTGWVPGGPGAVLGLPPLLAGSSLPPNDSGEGELVVVAGPVAGERFSLMPGRHVVGRPGEGSVTVAVADPSVSRRHAELELSPSGAFTVRDLGSLNGTAVLHAGEREVVRRSTQIPPDAEFSIGHSVLRRGTPPVAAAVVHPDGAGHLLLNRAPRLLPTPGARRWTWPVADPLPEGPGFPWLGLLVPLAVAVVLAVVWTPVSLLLGVSSPVVAAGQWAGQRRRHRRLTARRTADVAAERARVRAEVDDAARREHAGRHALHPGAQHLAAQVTSRGDRLFTRSPGDVDHLSARLGLGDLPADTASLQGGPGTPVLAGVPVTVALDAGPVGFCGPAVGVVRLVVAQLAGWQSPADVRLVTGPGWEWARWLPHHVEVADGDLLGFPVAELRRRRDRREAAREPAVVVVLDPVGWWRGDARLVELLTDGPALGVHTICLGDGRADLPAQCRTVVDAAAGRVLTAQDRLPVRLDAVSEEWAEHLARGLAPVLDAAAASGGAVPADVRLLDLLGPPTVESLQRSWSRSTGLPAVLGAEASGVCAVDLVRDGPHALLAGTTGSGKSVLLTTLVVSLALARAPEHLQFVLVDYKGGAAFGECTRLPHVAGLVTDLDDQLADRVLRSLRAEVSRRERVLAAAGVGDVRDLPAGRLARLVVVVDEFRVLSQEVPEFVDGLVRLASVGRSLGVHLVLATQRPAGVVSPEIRANTDLRIALRVQDRADADDVVGDPRPAGFTVPGRAVLRGVAGLREFQTARLRGPAGGSGVRVRVVGDPAPAGDVDDLPAVVEVVRAAAAGRPRPPAPWLPPLPRSVPARDVPAGSGTRLVWGVLDLPDVQARASAGWDLAAGHHLLVVGGVRSGRTTALRRIVTEAAGVADVEVHVLDAGGGLLDLAGTGATGSVVTPQEPWRAARLLERVQEEVDRRRAQRAWSGHLLVVVDGWEAWSAALTAADPAAGVDPLLRLLREGSATGVRVVVAGDRQALTGAVSSTVGAVVLLRTADRTDTTLLGVRPAAFPRDAPPGRGLFVVDGVGHEVQVVLPGEPGERAGRVPRCAVAPLPERVAGLTGPAVGRGGDTGGPVVVEVDGVVLVTGPPGSGRTSALRAFAAAEARSGGRVVWAREEEPAVVGEVLASGGLVLLDDMHRPLPPAVEDVVTAALLGPRGPRFVVAGDGAELVAAFRGPAATVRAAARTVVLLGRDGRVPAEVVSRRPVVSPGPGPGAGFVVRDGRWTSVRIACPTVAP
ncbi:S-DNA-T family DNA segregation ATPase FtsK/SpoIIIE [Kineococcus rhizosphaerae]|uniref:S-DNA-T family DNA segregation ATPase FtsK/SpoIIIE n=2 Tax=Kineococcus rhizosphaerae TaxID=559628 RepID=A0A2T0R3W2_9ACTN|nr:S-DNA-T family DNA segregation ATPase FtsK/SpoIIIE [Kineococcus rhizosphaerae]